MGRLLTEQEIRGIVQNTPAGVYDYEAVAQAQDDLTAHLVAIKIFKELEEPCPHEKGTLKADCRFCYQAIKYRTGGREWIGY